MKITRFAYIPSGTDLSALYRERVGDYPKFFKMDLSSKLGFLLTEMLVGGDPDRFEPRDDRAVLMFSRWGCLSNDRRYEETVREFPSPALFVYTPGRSPSGTNTGERPRPTCWTVRISGKWRLWSVRLFPTARPVRPSAAGWTPMTKRISRDMPFW